MDAQEAQEALSEIEKAFQTAVDYLEKGIGMLPVGESEYADVMSEALARASIAHAQLGLALRAFRLASEVVLSSVGSNNDGDEERAEIGNAGEAASLLSALWDAAEGKNSVDWSEVKRPYTMRLFVARYRLVVDVLEKKAKKRKTPCAPKSGLWGALCGWLDEALGGKEGRHAFFYAIAGKKSGKDFTACEKEALIKASGIAHDDEKNKWLPSQVFAEEIAEFAAHIEQLIGEMQQVSVISSQSETE